MDKLLQKIIFYLFLLLFFLVPLILWPHTSEVFEFNKIVLTYILTLFIFSVWAVRSIYAKKIIFSRTILDFPLLFFILSQTLSTLLSIDVYTSFFGYYSRFNGGLLSILSYSVLYWAYVSNLDEKDTKNLINHSLFPGAILVSIYAILEHFGIDKNIWVQDVQSRVFSTLGQPNWLAAWIVMLIPVSWALFINNFQISIKQMIKPSFYLLVSFIFFWVLIFTKSRSGFIGFLVADFIFWMLILAKYRISHLKNTLLMLFAIHLPLITISIISGTQWTPSLKSYLAQKQSAVYTQQGEVTASGTALETGGTESGTIRKIVWKGAFDIWKHYPIFGAGTETFAYSYYQFRPVAHNVTSEWDFIYNKAHNEFLNYLANTGGVGLIAYLVLIIFSIFQIYKAKSSQSSIVRYSLLSGYISLIVTNFFGFSVVPTQILFFLFSAMSVALSDRGKNQIMNNYKYEGKVNVFQKSLAALVLFLMVILLRNIGIYWYSDILYANAKAQNSAGRPDRALPLLGRAVLYEPAQAIYHAEIASTYSGLAMIENQNNSSASAAEFTKQAVDHIEEAVRLAPANIAIRRQMFGIYVRLSTVEDKYLLTARNSLISTIALAPTDAKLYYNLGVADANLDQIPKALDDFKKSIDLKPNYADARIEYASLLKHVGRDSEAKSQLEYILKNIDPANTVAKNALDNLK